MLVKVRRKCDGYGCGAYEGEPDHRSCEYRYAAIFHRISLPVSVLLLMFNHILLVADWTWPVIALRMEVNAGLYALGVEQIAPRHGRRHAEM